MGENDFKVKIRKATLGDAAKIHALIREATNRGKILKRSLKEIKSSIHHFWVLEIEKRLVACCALEIYNKKLAEIRSLTVDSKEEKKGLATLLIEQCLKESKARRVYEVLAITDRENLFKRQGFSEQLHGQKALFLRN